MYKFEVIHKEPNTSCSRWALPKMIQITPDTSGFQPMSLVVLPRKTGNCEVCIGGKNQFSSPPCTPGLHSPRDLSLQSPGLCSLLIASCKVPWVHRACPWDGLRPRLNVCYLAQAICDEVDHKTERGSGAQGMMRAGISAMRLTVG